MATAPKSTHIGGGDGPKDAAGLTKDLIVTAILCLAIFGPIVGLKTVTVSGALALDHRWTLVALLTAVTVGGRFLIHMYNMSKTESVAPAKAAKPSKADSPLAKFVSPILLLVAIMLPFLASFTGDRERQIMDMAILIITYIMLGWGLNIVVGLAGLLGKPEVEKV